MQFNLALFPVIFTISTVCPVAGVLLSKPESDEVLFTRLNAIDQAICAK